jgi:hypothetical protein
LALGQFSGHLAIEPAAKPPKLNAGRRVEIWEHLMAPGLVLALLAVAFGIVVIGATVTTV